MREECKGLMDPRNTADCRKWPQNICCFFLSERGVSLPYSLMWAGLTITLTKEIDSVQVPSPGIKKT